MLNVRNVKIALPGSWRGWPKRAKRAKREDSVFTPADRATAEPRPPSFPSKRPSPASRPGCAQRLAHCSRWPAANAGHPSTSHSLPWRLHFTISDASHLQCHSRSLLLVPAQVDGTITIFCQRGRARRLGGDALTAEQQLHLQDHEQRQVPAENCPLKLLPSNCLCSQYAGQLQSVRRARPGRFTELVVAGLLLTG